MKWLKSSAFWMSVMILMCLWFCIQAYNSSLEEAEKSAPVFTEMAPPVTRETIDKEVKEWRSRNNVPTPAGK